VLSRDVKIVDIDPHQYENLVSVIRQRGSGGILEAPALIVFFRDNKAVHAVHTTRGPLEDVKYSGPSGMERMMSEHGVERVACIEVGSIRRLWSNAQAHMRHDMTMWEQILAVRTAARKEFDSGIHIYPDPLGAVPPLPGFVVKLIRLLVPARILLSVAAFEGDRVWTSLILGIRNGEISLITTTDSLGTLKLHGRQIADHAAAVNRAVKNTWEEPTAGFYMDRSAFEQLASHPYPVSALSRLSRRKWIFVEPFPGRLRILLSLAGFLNF